jgi:hypothetical protein
MTINQSDVVRGAAIGLALAGGVGVVAIPFLVWGSEHSPEFFGAFAAAIVAAIAVVLGAYCQHDLMRKRDAERRDIELIGETIELMFWLDYAAKEMDFIAVALREIHTRMIECELSEIEMPVVEFRRVVSARFMDELLARAKEASKLPEKVAAPVVQTLYDTASQAERIYDLRVVSPAFKPQITDVETYIKIVQVRADKLHEAKEIIGVYVREKAA